MNVTPASSDYPWKAVRAGGVFKNLVSGFYPSLLNFLAWKLKNGADDEDGMYEEEDYQPNVVIPDMDDLWHPPLEQVVTTWVGHSTFLIQMGGLNFLTDPHFGGYCAPVEAKEYLRQSPPGLRIDQLPRIDAVLISHDHYDHLDRQSLKALAAYNRSAYDEDLPIICPTGLARLLKKWGLPSITELSWGDTLDFGDRSKSTITALPAQHGSGRGLFDHNKTLWCGYLLDSGKNRVAFLGDTGYAPFFSWIGERYPGIDLALIPIGAYRPNWFMKSIHLHPNEALQVHKDLKAKQSVAMHWGTFLMGDEPVSEPRVFLLRALVTAKLPKSALRTLGFGETISVQGLGESRY